MRRVVQRESSDRGEGEERGGEERGGEGSGAEEWMRGRDRDGGGGRRRSEEIDDKHQEQGGGERGQWRWWVWGVIHPETSALENQEAARSSPERQLGRLWTTDPATAKRAQ